MESNNYARTFRTCCVALAAIAACGPKADTTSTPIVQSPPPSRHEATPTIQTATLLAAVPSECRGAELDLLAIARVPVCKVADKPESLPDGVSLSLGSAAISVESGFDAKSHLVLRNDTARAVVLVLDATCDYLNLYESQILDASGARADRVGRACVGEAQGCAGKVVRVALEPGGSAKLPYTVRAEIQVSNAACTGIGKRALPSGDYDLVISTSLRTEPIKATLTVRGSGP